ncbi:hypothetical protein [Haloarcula amylovorans]|uniref:hypothetical protein n=1 Tax=Haloarcula amylovorans TaxID=2562280 RepID=UPI00107696CD|nr:hypothetical protein [Halomicroarcula amylolytica]
MTANKSNSPFEGDVIRAVASENDVEEGQLRDALEAHQRVMHDNPGVEDLVYEWRRQYDDPVLARTPETFFVAVPPTVWEEYGDFLGLDDYVLRALSAVHQEQTLRSDAVDLSGMPEGHATIVVSRADRE